MLGLRTRLVRKGAYRLWRSSLLWMEVVEAYLDSVTSVRLAAAVAAHHALSAVQSGLDRLSPYCDSLHLTGVRVVKRNRWYLRW